jgi:hypothetical protein
MIGDAFSTACAVAKLEGQAAKRLKLDRPQSARKQLTAFRPQIDQRRADML